MGIFRTVKVTLYDEGLRTIEELNFENDYVWVKEIVQTNKGCYLFAFDYSTAPNNLIIIELDKSGEVSKNTLYGFPYT